MTIYVFLFWSTILSLSFSITTALPVTVSLFDTLLPDTNAIHANDVRFGLVGDGIHDDTDGLLSALNATYFDPGRPNCTLPGSRIVFLEGNGKIYRLTRTIDIRTWQRIIGYGTSRPVLYVSTATPGFTNESNVQPLLRGNCYAPGSGFNPNYTDGSNIAFGTGIINVDIRIAAGNPGATAVRWRIAQGGIIRGVTINLADDTHSGIYFPGWAHQDIVITGGKYGIYIGDTGAWPSSYRDILLQNQSIAAIAQANFNGPPYPFPAGDWEGSVFSRITIQNTPYGFLSLPAYGGDPSQPLLPSPVRCIWRNIRWSNISTAVVSLSNFSSFQPAAFTIIDAQGDIATTMNYIFVDNEPPGNGTRYNIPVNSSSSYVQTTVNSSSSSYIDIQWFHAGYDVPSIQQPSTESINIHANFTFHHWIIIVPTGTVPPLPPTDIAPYPTVPVNTYLVANASNGIIGDGITDITIPLNALLQLSATTNRPVYLPTGVYMVSSPIELPPNAVLFGLHCWDTVIRLFDNAGNEYKNISSPYPIVHVLPGENVYRTTLNTLSSSSSSSSRSSIASSSNNVQLRIGGLNIQSASGNYTNQPSPVPTGWMNPNPGAIGLLWETGGSTLVSGVSSYRTSSTMPTEGAFDIFFHPASFPDNHRIGKGNNTEYSLYIQGVNATGSFADIWTCNSYAFGGTWVIDSQGPGIFYQLSDEHHYGHEVTFVNAANWEIWTMQTEDRMDDCSQTIPLNLVGCQNITIGQLQTNRDGNVTTGAAIAIENRPEITNANILSLHLHVYVWNYHNRTPVNFNATVCDSASGNCVVDVDVGLVGDGIPQ